MKWTDNKRKAFEKAAGRTSPAGGAQIQGGGSTPQPTTPPPATAEEANQANPLEGGGTIQHGPATQPPSAPSTNSQPQSPNARGGGMSNGPQTPSGTADPDGYHEGMLR